ncbi:MAG: hypothetical protein ABR955_11115 [Verrucomicrobiota bacterium]
MNFNIEPIVLRKLSHPRQRHLNHFNNRRNFNACVSANDMDFFCALLIWNGQNRFKNKRSNKRAVFASAKADHPRARITKIKRAQIFCNDAEIRVII